MGDDLKFLDAMSHDLAMAAAESEDEALAAAERRGYLRAMKEAEEIVPTNWLHPLLTGPDAVLPASMDNLDASHIEALLRAVKGAIRAARKDEEA